MHSAESVLDAERIARLEALVERLGALAQQPTSLSSVTVTRNAKTETQFEVKAYGGSIEDAGQRAEAEYRRLCVAFGGQA